MRRGPDAGDAPRAGGTVHRAVVLTRRVSVSCYGAQSQRGGTFPLGVEAAGVGEFVSGSGLGEQVHAAARADGGELVVVIDQQLRPTLSTCLWMAARAGCAGGRTSRSCARATRTSSGWSRARRTSKGAGGVTLRGLVGQALRVRSDRLVVGGEVRGAQVCDLAQVLRRGCCRRAVAGVVDRPDRRVGGWGEPRAVFPCSGSGPAGLACG
jgi:hypothetical protein